MKEITAQIYKSDARGKSQDEAFTRLSVFNFDDFQDAARKPFGNLLAVNEETIGPKHKVFRHIESDTDIIIIPLAGAIRYTDSLENDDIIQTGHIRVFSAHDALSYTLENPYGEDLINYLQLWIKPNGEITPDSQQQKFNFPGKNKLFPVFSGQEQQQTGETNGENVLKVGSQSTGYMGIFENKISSMHQLANPDNGMFVFIINGAFEFENRLLEKGDALALEGVPSAKFEALAQNALLFVMEVPL